MLVVGILYVSVPTFVLADPGADLSEREASAAMRLGRIQEVTYWHARLRQARESIFLGEAGLLAKVRQWYVDANDWVRSGYALLATLEAAEGQLGERGVQAELRDALTRYQAAWATLRRSARDARTHGHQMERLSDKMVELPEDIVAGYDEQSRQLNQRWRELRSAATSVLAALEDERLQAWEDTIVPTAQLLRLSLVKAALVAPDLRAELEVVSQELEAEMTFHPLMERVNEAYRAVRQVVLEHRFFGTQKAMQRLKEARAAALATADTAPVDAVYKREFEAALTNLTQAAGVLGEQQQYFTPQELIGRMLQQELPILSGDCRDQDRRRLRNCDLLRSIAFLTPEHLELMDEGELQYVEDALDSVLAGPVAGLQRHHEKP